MNKIFLGVFFGLGFVININANNLNNTIDKNSAKFFEKPYLLNPLGEGASGRYDQKPRIRLDAFDCMTYVETVLALSLSNQNQSTKNLLDKIRYYKTPVDYKFRNHFTELDWNTSNEKHGFIEDLTTTITDKNHKPLYITVNTTIDKGAWFQHLTSKNIYLIKNSKAIAKARLKELHEYGKNIKPQTIKLTYLPIVKLLQQPNTLQQIPNAVIIEIVRPNWDLTKAIGTRLNISHLGFGIWKDNVLYFRNASSIYHKVTEEPLIKYLNRVKDSPTIKGIKIFKIKS